MRSVHVHWFAVELKDKERKINSGKTQILILHKRRGGGREDSHNKEVGILRMVDAQYILYNSLYMSLNNSTTVHVPDRNSAVAFTFLLL